MNIAKKELRSLILESYNKFLAEQNIPPEEAKKFLKQNAVRHINMLKLLKATIKRVKLPTELQNMIEQLKKSDSTTFINQVLGVKDTVPIKVSAILENPLDLINDVIDEILIQSIRAANQKLKESKLMEQGKEELELMEEEDLPFLARDTSRLSKHEKKMKKKGIYPKPNIPSSIP